MRKGLLLFILAIILLAVSAPLTVKMVLEKMYEVRMDYRYDIQNIDYISSSENFSFGGKSIVVYHDQITDTYQDPWRNQMLVADIHIAIASEVLEKLEGYAVEGNVVGLSQYGTHVALLKVDENKQSEKLIVLIKKSKQHVTENERGDHVGYVPDRELWFRSYTIGQEGNILKEDFTFTERNRLQTQLLNRSGLYQQQIGYYTDAWKSYPVLWFPFIYPFATFLVGAFLINQTTCKNTVC